jgi:hypothetical protein
MFGFDSRIGLFRLVCLALYISEGTPFRPFTHQQALRAASGEVTYASTEQ